ERNAPLCGARAAAVHAASRACCLTFSFRATQLRCAGSFEIAGGARGGGGMTRRLPLGGWLGAGGAFAAGAGARAPGALALFAVTAALPFYAPGLFVGDWVGPLSAVLAMVAGLIAQGALYRLGVSRDVRAARALGLGPMGLQFGAAEMRLLAAAV